MATKKRSKSTSGKNHRRRAKVNERVTISIVTTGVLLTLLAYIPGDSFWSIVRGVFFGVLGVSMYFVGPGLIWLAVLYNRKKLGAMPLELLLATLLVSALATVFSGQNYMGVPAKQVVLQAFLEAQGGGWHGGVAGTLLGASLNALGGTPVANLVVIGLILLDIYIFFPIVPDYIVQKLRSFSEDSRDYINDNRERRAEAARRSEELKERNDQRRVARLEREAAIAAEMAARPRRSAQVDIPLPGEKPRKAEEKTAAGGLAGVLGRFSRVDIPVPKSKGAKPVQAEDQQAAPAAAAVPPAEPVQPHFDIGPGGTFGLAAMQEALAHNPPPRPAAAAAPSQPTPAAHSAPEPAAPAVGSRDADLWAAMGDPLVIEGQVPAPETEVPAPEAKSENNGDEIIPAAEDSKPHTSGELEALIQKAAMNGSMSSNPEAELQQEETAAYEFPTLDLLEEQEDTDDAQAESEMREKADILVNTLESFGVKTRMMDICRGPSVTRYELQPLAGVKISRITSLADDIALNLAKAGVRIEAPIPGKPAVGIEVPNDVKTSVRIRGIFESQNYAKATSPLTLALGKDIAGTAQVADLCKMPHLLIAGSTGSGKSVCVNSIIISFLYRSSPEDVKLLLIDPKVVELAEYNGIPHLLMPVVTEPRKAAGALGSAVGEMERRYRLFAENNVRDIKTFNKLADSRGDLERLPYIAIVIDELADLMMVSGKEVEDYICRIAQKARAAGMHLIVATQRPSVDVITGLIKANIPSRIAFAVSSQVDSRTILDSAGAEKLLGSGDMLFLPVGAPKPVRIQGTYVKDEEISAVLNFIKEGGDAQYDEAMIASAERLAAADSRESSDSEGGSHDPMFEQAVEAVIDMGQASTSMLQRRCKLGYARAARIMDEMEQEGIIGPYEGAKPRPVLISRQQWIERKMNCADGPAAAND